MVNPGNSSVAPVTGSTLATEYFANYPALIKTYVRVLESTGVTLNLMDYSPQTVNTAVQQTGSSGSSTGATQSTSSTSTTGNSYTQSSTYGTSVTVGDTFSGATASYEYSTSQTTDSLKSTGQDKGSRAAVPLSR